MSCFFQASAMTLTLSVRETQLGAFAFPHKVIYLPRAPGAPQRARRLSDAVCEFSLRRCWHAATHMMLTLQVISALKLSEEKFFFLFSISVFVYFGLLIVFL